MADKIARNLDPTGGVQWPSDTERRAELDRKVGQATSKDPLTRAVEAQPGVVQARVPTFELAPKNNTSLEAADRASRHETAEHKRRLEEIPHLYNRGGSVKHGSSTHVACAKKV
jgi:hypothetical protein